MEDLRQKMGATLSERYTSAQKGTAKMMNDYEKMRKDLMRVGVQKFCLNVTVALFSTNSFQMTYMNLLYTYK